MLPIRVHDAGFSLGISYCWICPLIIAYAFISDVTASAVALLMEGKPVSQVSGLPLFDHTAVAVLFSDRIVTRMLSRTGPDVVENAIAVASGGCS